MPAVRAPMRGFGLAIVGVALFAGCLGGGVREAEDLADRIRDLNLPRVERVVVRQPFLDEPVVEVYVDRAINDQEAASVWCDLYGTWLSGSLHRRPPMLLRVDGTLALEPVPSCVLREGGYVPEG